MALFESMLVLLGISVVLLHGARRLNVPYPAILALSGGLVAALPWAPNIAIEPHLALAIFVAPAVFDTAYELPPRELRRNWLPLTSLAILLIIATTGAVAWVGYMVAGLPIYAAVALGAIVSPPDAAAASAVLNQFKLPRRMMVVLQGESLLNDAVALLIFGAAISHATGSQDMSNGPFFLLALQVPFGIALGAAMGYLVIRLLSLVAGTLSTIIVQFTVTFGTWVLADRLHFSAIAAVVSLAMMMAHYLPSKTTSRERVNGNAVWRSVVFVLNVLAFLLLGLQARTIIGRLDSGELWKSVEIGLLVLLVVIGVRIIWVLTYGFLLRVARPLMRRHAPQVFVPNRSVGVLISWCGMRGLVTLATAFALPEGFPGRDQIVMTAFIVVLGTIVIQGLSLRPLIAFLNIKKDDSETIQTKKVRSAMFSAAISTLQKQTGDAAHAMRNEYEEMLKKNELDTHSQFLSTYFPLRLIAIQAERATLHEWRRLDLVDDNVYYRFEEILDWAELHASDPDESDISEA